MRSKVWEERISSSPVCAHTDAREERKRWEGVEAEKKRRKEERGREIEIKRERESERFSLF